MQIKYKQNNIILMYKGHRISRIINSINNEDGQYVLTIRYVNEYGIEIFPTEMQILNNGDAYDMSFKINTVIDGFNFKEIQGPVLGVINENTEIVLIYETVPTNDNNKVIYEIPYISYGYWNPKPYNTEENIIPLYITDFYQKEYLENDTSLTFDLRVEVDGEVTWINNIPSGDYELNLGKLDTGMHYFTVQVVDEAGEESARLANDIWVIDEEHDIKESETYSITEQDLIDHNITINLDETATAEQMKNNRCGLSQLFLDIKNEGYRKCVLPKAIYRVNRTRRTLGDDGTATSIDKGDICIDIPSNFTVDMNQSTFKLHPYNDEEYGTIGSVENLIVRMKKCIDSHLINGTIEGDFAERSENGWASGNNGEHNNTFYFYGGKYNSLENIKIYQTTGYNVCTGQAGNLNGNVSLGALSDNVKLVDGEEVMAEGYCSSDYSDLSNATSKYIVCSVWLAMGGIKTQHWDIDFSFYDKDKRFIEKIRCYQYRRCRIPDGAQYIRTTFKGAADVISDISYHHMDVARYCEIKNCDWVDNRTCCAPFQFQHLYINKCNFTRSGQSITPCEIDLEDGWEQMQDFFLIDSHVLEHAGTATLIDNGGINHVIEKCTGWSNMLFRYKTNGITVRNNTECGCDVKTGWMTKNTVRIYDNELNSVSGSCVDDNHYLYDKMNYVYKNNICNLKNIEKFKPYWHMDNCEVNITGYQSNVTLDNSIIRIKSGDAYLNGNLIYNNCTFELYEGDSTTKFSFNVADAYRLWNTCIFNNPLNLSNHNAFNSGIFDNCVFNETIDICNEKPNVLGDLVFNNCIFNKQVTCKNKNESYIRFVNCVFIEGVAYGNTIAQSLCEFINE